jgi:hypothetical protein
MMDRLKEQMLYIGNLTAVQNIELRATSLVMVKDACILYCLSNQLKNTLK